MGIIRDFSSFFAKFLAYLIIFHSGACSIGTVKFWKIIKYAKILAKNEEKQCSTCLKPIYRLIPDTEKYNFGYLIPVLSYTFRPTKTISMAQILPNFFSLKHKPDTNSAQKWRSLVGTSISYSAVTITYSVKLFEY